MSQLFPQDPPDESAEPAAPPHHETILAGVRWRSAFEFTYLFRGFRLAMNPAKLIIALLAIAAIYAGGRIFDGVWGPRVYKNEIETFQSIPATEFRKLYDSTKLTQQAALADLLQSASADDTALSPDQLQALSSHPRAAESMLRNYYIDKFHKDVLHAAPEDRAAAAATLEANIDALHDAVGQGIFDSFMAYEIKQFDALIENTLTFVRISPMHGPANAAGDESQAVSGGLFSKNPERLWYSDTVLGCLANMTITAPHWLFTGAEPMQWRPDPPDRDTWKGWAEVWLLHRLPYLLSLVILLAFWLLLIALGGGMICRMSALEFAGREDPPIPEIWTFTRSRLRSFFAAPLLPLLIILALGAVLSVFGLIGAVPYIGEILLGLAFIFFIATAFVMMLVTLGVIGGFNLMYPTISVEGSDAFDACSRSWAYVYGAPWRLILYTVISLVYGIITLLFVSFAAYLVLALTHTFVGFGTDFFGAIHGHYNGLPKLDTLWPAPQLNALSQPINWYAMNWSEWLGSVFLSFWVFFVITLVGAYVMSFYYSIHTIIYLLLRRAVEGQSLSEVYQDEDSAAVAEPPPASPAQPPVAPATIPPIVTAEAPSHPVSEPPISPAAQAAENPEQQ